MTDGDANVKMAQQVKRRKFPAENLVLAVGQT